MAVYIDPLFKCKKSINWKWEHASHMTADSIDELHKFAKSIGLRKEWFQNKRNHIHYDLTPFRRIKALEKGAIELSKRDYVKKVRELRKGYS